MELIEAIKNRRSIRKYKNTPVKERDLETVLDAARWAPSWANTQCTRFIVVKDAKKKAEVMETLSPNNPSRVAIDEAPVLIVACAELGRSGYKKGEVSTDKGDWFMFDAGLAMQNLVLAAYALGLGTVHIGLFDAKKAAEILEVPEGFVVVEMTPLGYPDMEGKTPSRKELSEIVSYDKFDIHE